MKHHTNFVSILQIILITICNLLLLNNHSFAEQTYTNSLGMRFVYIPAGSFFMGSPKNEKGRNWNETLHKVTLSRGFYMGETEVTQGQWNRLVSPNPSSFKLGDKYPVDSVSWNEVMQFISFLNSYEHTDKYRLPTEAEWEYACRAGSNTAFSGGPITTFSCKEPEPALVHTAWYCYNSGEKEPPDAFSPHPVKQLSANAWGLYDMQGNVQEWVMDSCEGRNMLTGRVGVITNTYKQNVVDPVCTKGPYRVFRGGGWYQGPKYQRCAFRGYYKPVTIRNSLGFRLVRME